MTDTEAQFPDPSLLKLCRSTYTYFKNVKLTLMKLFPYEYYPVSW